MKAKWKKIENISNTNATTNTNSNTNSNNNSSNSNSTSNNTSQTNNSTTPNTNNPSTNTNTNPSTNNNQPSSTPSNNTSNERVTEVSREKIDEEGTVTYKYGTKISEIKSYYIIKYSDGTEKTEDIETYTDYDYSTFNGTTNDLKPEATSVANSNKQDYQEILNYTNQYRQEIGVEPLTLDDTLCIMATVRAIEMAYSNIFEHIRPDKRNVFTIYSDFNYSSYSKGENIAMGYISTKDVSEGWKNSQGHYENMTRESFKKIGIGKYKIGRVTYWVQLFAA